jgi:hypothetical protein
MSDFLAAFWQVVTALAYVIGFLWLLLLVAVLLVLALTPADRPDEPVPYVLTDAADDLFDVAHAAVVSTSAEDEHWAKWHEEFHALPKQRGGDVA